MGKRPSVESFCGGWVSRSGSCSCELFGYRHRRVFAGFDRGIMGPAPAKDFLCSKPGCSGGCRGIGRIDLVSLYLAAMRVYQVGECMETFVSNIIATASDKSVVGQATLFQMILSLFINTNGGAIDLLALGRVVMLMVFWINWLLMACATGIRLLSRPWIFALAGAATLAPIWDYGLLRYRGRQ